MAFYIDAVVLPHSVASDFVTPHDANFFDGGV